MINPFPSSKKGQGISMETIVIAVIVVSVLVILLLVFTGRINWFGGQLRVCAASGGVCTKNVDCSGVDGQNRATLFTIDSKNSDKQCGASDMKFCCSGVGTPVEPTS